MNRAIKRQLDYTVGMSNTEMIASLFHILYVAVFTFSHGILSHFLPRCMECRRNLAMRILSLRLSSRPSHA